MKKYILFAITGFLLGGVLGFIVVQQIPLLTSKKTVNTITELSESLGLKKHKVIGFLPYWLLSNADKDYSQYITTLTYFGLTLESDGTIQKITNPGESEPGWHTLNSGKMDEILKDAKDHNLELSLLVFSGNEENIAGLMSDPEKHAQNMIEEISPIMKQYGFTDLNIDIESVKVASPEARTHFTEFISEVKKQVNKQKLGTLTIDVSPTAMLRDYLINVDEVAPLVDYMVFMTYDYHYMGSYVTGPVSPIGGMGTEAESDIQTGIQLAKEIMPEHKIILGIPSYGYGWETVSTDPRSAVIPGSGLVISNRKLENLLSECTNCEIQFDTNAKEYYVVYEDEETGTYHQIFYPEEKATKEKIQLAETHHLGGIAIWALGYEGDTLLRPLADYK